LPKGPAAAAATSVEAIVAEAVATVVAEAVAAKERLAFVNAYKSHLVVKATGASTPAAATW
jgi:hypothetical protein